MSKIKCFHCHEHGHYAKNCPQKKESKKDPTVAAIGEALASQFELDFTLIACMVNNMIESLWYLDNGALFHMMGNIEFLSDLEEKDPRRTLSLEMMEGTMLLGLIL